MVLKLTKADRALVNKYAPNAPIVPPTSTVPDNGVSYRVPTGNLMSVAEAEEILRADIETNEEEVRKLLIDAGFSVDQAQFDALVNLRYHRFVLDTEIVGLVKNDIKDPQLWEAAIRNRIGDEGDKNRADDLVKLYNEGEYK